VVGIHVNPTLPSLEITQQSPGTQAVNDRVSFLKLHHPSHGDDFLPAWRGGFDLDVM